MHDYKLYTFIGAMALRRKIAAIKCLKELVPGMALIDAKRWVEKYWEFHADDIVNAVNIERRASVEANIARLEAERSNIICELQNAKNLLADIGGAANDYPSGGSAKDWPYPQGY